MDLIKENNSTMISVILCAYTSERWSDLIEAVESLQAQCRLPDEIIVVIDHNRDLLARAEKALAGIHLVENRNERGLSGARNSGAAAARGDILVFMDEDAVADPECLERLMAWYQATGVIGVGGAIKPLWHEKRPRWFPEEFDWVVGCTYKGMPEEAGEIRNLIGCNMSIKSHTFHQLHGFRNGIGRIGKHPLGGEETELCIRASQLSPESVFIYEPRARVRHKVPLMRCSLRYFFSRCYFEGRSKAQIASLVGTRDSLAAEKKYTLRTLPAGVLKGLKDAFLGGDISGFAKAAMICAGLLTTTSGYLFGVVHGKVLRRWEILNK
jgi:glucosyl-dolichyl phosphate glucuronosyltransferase